ncbi:hypothetical protein CAL14_15190 [Bordetella genomosp. 9]|uniref:DUF748 domain-containing protein n=1 Tax=Bordetella genomosp. 9 TaxID=1416803 RepID=UPI000A28F39F|nr:DUF748 domain-containing protein [Bordetella genomosp. 9]ARP91461.1 hypothetical protein CAL14_15190 [Bordetella genomosp. 9]
MRKSVKYVVIPVVVVAILAALAMHVAARVVVARIQDLLGDQGHAARIDVGWSQIVLENVEIGAPPDWPARQTLRAARATLEPDWRALLSDRISIRRVVISDYYLSVLRAPGGRLEILPTLRERARQRADEQAQKNGGQSGEDKPKRETDVGQLVLESGRLDFFDGQVAKKPYRVPFENVHAEIGPLHAPANNAQTKVDMKGEIVGKKRRGTAQVTGWLAMPSRDADVRTTLAGADVSLLAPYLQRHSPSVLTGGQMDLDMTTRVQNQQLDAHGKVRLRDTEFSNNLGSIPRKAVIAALENRKGEVTFDFTLQGSLKDPKFSLTDDMSTRIVGGFAKAIGVSVEGVAEGVGSAVKGLGGALGELIGK